MSLAQIMTGAVIMAGGFLAACGAVLMRLGPPALERLGHRDASLIPVFAGRYFAMAMMLVALSALGEWRALAVVLVIGGAMGCLDVVLVRRVGGPALPHAVAAVVCLALAAGALAVAGRA